MSKKGGSQTVSSSPDAGTQDWVNRVRSAATAYGGATMPGVDPRVTQAGNTFAGAAGVGNLGMGAMAGDPSSVSAFMNPYTQNVLHQQGNLWDTINQRTMNAVNDRATQANAFGGSRAAVATGSALSQNNQAQAAQGADLLSSGYNDAMSRADRAANLGMGGAYGLQGVGQYSRDVAMQQDPRYQQLRSQLMASGMPGGSTQTTTQNPGSNPWSALLGGGSLLAGMGLLGPLGGLIGGGLSGLFHSGGGSGNTYGDD